MVYETESTYNLIQVVEDSSARRYLLLNEGQGIHSVYTPPQQYRAPKIRSTCSLADPDYYLIAPYSMRPPTLSRQCATYS